MSDSSDDRNPLDALAEEFLERFRRGERPALSEYTSRYPELAGDIRELFPALVMLEEVRPASAGASEVARRAGSATAQPERLGDYRILRELGRGGMGIVYEAEQESLGRHVALKVLPAHALLQPRQLERFQREARSAARLHHTNIVPVFGVGEQDGLHYYVMQFIHGQGLDQVLAVLQRLRGRTPDNVGTVAEAPSAGLASAAAVANALLTGVFALPPAEPGAGAAAPTVAHAAPVPTSSSSSTVRLPGQPSDAALSDSGQPYWHSIARIGIQVADALSYAHAQGTLHRDIKPANLLLDTQGVVWVTDFGLAKAVGSENLTHTGDVVGTLRYMAPERLRGKADARSDIYGLGLTLYELLTLQAAFAGSERDKLLLQVMQHEPVRPRKLNPAVPRDLETIVLKAVARDPKHRYQGAADLAADLTRFTEDKPIRARPVSETEKLWRWCRRNPSFAALAGAFVLALVLGVVGTGSKWLDAEAEREKVSDAERQTARERDRAMSARNDAQRLLAGARLDRGIALGEQGEIGEGLLWMHEALRSAGPNEAELTRAIRINIAAWLAQAHRLEQLAARPGSVNWCLYTPDGKRLLTGGEAGVESWVDGASAHLAVPGRAEAALALSPDGRILVTGDNPTGGVAGLVQRWDLATGQPLGAPLRHPGRLRGAIFAADGRSFFTGGADGTVQRWDSQTGAQIGPGYAHPQRYVAQLALSPDGNTLAVATGVPGDAHERDAAELQLWDLATGKPLVEPLRHRGLVHTVAFAPDGKTVLTGCEDRTAQLWDARTGQPLGAPLRHSHPVTVVRFTPDGRTIATGSQDGVIRWWNAATGAPLVGTLALPQANVTNLAVNADGTALAAVCATGQRGSRVYAFRLAQAAARPPARSTEALVKATWRVGEGETWLGRYWVGVSPDAALVVAAHGRHWASLRDAATGQPHLVAGGADGPLWNAWQAVGVNVISPNRRVVATSSRDVTAVGEARLWDAVTGKLIGAPLRHANYVSALAFSPDSRLVATGCYDGTVQLWDSATGRRHGAPLDQPDIVLSLAFSPDGKTLAAGHAHDHCGYYGVVLWDLAQRRHVWPPVRGPSSLLQFSPDGKRVLGSALEQLQFWDTATGACAGPLLHETAEINSASFTPDGSVVLLSTTDGTVWLREVPTGKPLGAPMRNPYRVNFAIFSRDAAASLIVAGYDDGSVRLWDRATQKPLGPPLPQGRRVVAGAFTPDGHAVTTSSDKGQTRQWQVPLPVEDELKRLALRLEVATGLTMGDGQTVVPLTAAQWQERRARLAALPLPRTADRAEVCAYHDGRARDAEQEDDVYAARWHLERLFAARAKAPLARAAPPLWQLHARRGRLAASHGEFQAAAADYAAVTQAAPAQVVGWYRDCILDCLITKEAVAARWYAEQALAQVPGDWRLLAMRAEALGQLGKTAERDTDLTAAARHGADSTFLTATGAEFAARGQWTKAAAFYEQALARAGLSASDWRSHALVLLKAGEHDRYRALCHRLVDAEAATQTPGTANLVAWICALGPQGLDDYTQPIRLAEQAVRAAHTDGRRAGVLNTLGGVLLRAGRNAEAIARLNEGIHLGHGSGGPHDWLFLALAHFHRGDVAQARQYLARVAPPTPARAFSFNGLELELLRQEAIALIK